VAHPVPLTVGVFGEISEKRTLRTRRTGNRMTAMPYTPRS